LIKIDESHTLNFRYTPVRFLKQDRFRILLPLNPPPKGEERVQALSSVAITARNEERPC